jgi:hypothetical protein
MGFGRGFVVFCRVFFAGFFLWVFGTARWDCFVDAKLHRPPSTLSQPLPNKGSTHTGRRQDGKEKAKSKDIPKATSMQTY